MKGVYDMIISRLFASAGKHGTVAVEGVFAGICGLGILLLRKFVVIPVKEDTRAELVERGYTPEEIREAEGSAKNCLKEAAITLFGLRGSERIHGPEEPDVYDVPKDDSRPQAGTE